LWCFGSFSCLGGRPCNLNWWLADEELMTGLFWTDDWSGCGFACVPVTDWCSWFLCSRVLGLHFQYVLSSFYVISSCISQFLFYCFCVQFLCNFLVYFKCLFSLIL
jgi:hypothetical protein